MTDFRPSRRELAGLLMASGAMAQSYDGAVLKKAMEGLKEGNAKAEADSERLVYHFRPPAAASW